MKNLAMIAGLILMVGCDNNGVVGLPPEEAKLVTPPKYLVPIGTTKIGAISYFFESDDNNAPSSYNHLPITGLSVINPNNGALKQAFVKNEAGITIGQSTEPFEKLAKYIDVVDQQHSRGVKMLGYVPVGYFDHEFNYNSEPGDQGDDVDDWPCGSASTNPDDACPQTLDRITAQVKTYFAKMPNLKGIFFDEAGARPWDCSIYASRQQGLRKIVKEVNRDWVVAWNPGDVDPCMYTEKDGEYDNLNAYQYNEIVLSFEGDSIAYNKPDTVLKQKPFTDTMHGKGIAVWHVIYDVEVQEGMEAIAIQAMKNVANRARSLKADLAYITDSYGKRETYWESERAFFAGGENNGAAFTRKIKSVANGQCLGTDIISVSPRLVWMSCNSATPRMTKEWTMSYVNFQGQHYYQMKIARHCLTSTFGQVLEGQVPPFVANLQNCKEIDAVSSNNTQLFAVNKDQSAWYFTIMDSEKAITLEANANILPVTPLALNPYDWLHASKFYLIEE